MLPDTAARIPRVVDQLPGWNAMQQVNRPTILEYMTNAMLSRLTPAAKVTLSRTPLFSGQPSADVRPQLIRMDNREPVIANHEAMHILSYNTPGMFYGTFPKSVDVPLEFSLRMASEYGGGTQAAMNQYGTGMETYPMAPQVAGWNPWAIPEILKPYYANWMDMRPESTWWH